MYRPTTARCVITVTIQKGAGQKGVLVSWVKYAHMYIINTILFTEMSSFLVSSSTA